jgi:hypothetical protein
MFGISKLSSAVRALADNVTALATTVAEVNHGVRSRLALDGPETADGRPPPRSSTTRQRSSRRPRRGHAPGAAGSPSEAKAEANHGPGATGVKSTAVAPIGGKGVSPPRAGGTERRPPPLPRRPG